jgi:hypothetical protein
MGKLTIVDWTKLIGFMLVVVATIISTVIIPSIDEELSELNKEIFHFKDSRILAGISMLHYGGQRIFRRIELFEANQLIIAKQDKQSVNELRKRALEQTARMAGEWATLLGGDEAEIVKKETETQINEIIENENLTFNDKLTKVEEIWTDNITKASERLKKAHEKYHQHKSLKENIGKNKSIWTKGFAWLQILGLILFSGAEIIGKLFKTI